MEMTKDEESSQIKGKQPTVASPSESVSWDLDQLMKAVNSPTVRMPDNIKDYGGFREWINSLTDDDFKSN